LRRQIAIVAAAKDLDRFDMLSANYLRRFARSVYAGAFRRQFAADVAGREDAGSAGRMTKLAAALGPSTRPSASTSISRSPARPFKGKAELARLAADAAARLAEKDSAEQRRARLYEAAALVAGNGIEKGVSALEAMDKAGLDEEDAELFDAAKSVAAEVRRLPAPSEASGEEAGAPPKAVEAARQSMARADQSIEAVSK
jgi:chemotaxis protein MotC